MAYESGFRTTLATRLDSSDTTMSVATAPTITAWRLFLKSWTQREWISFTGVTWTTLTGLTRGLSQTADPATSWTGLTWLAGTTVIIVAMHDQIIDKANANTLSWNNTFSGDNEFSWTTTISGAANITWDSSSWDAAWSDFKIRDDSGTMKFRDDSTAVITLSTIAAASWADQYVATSENDTTVWHLEDKLTAGTGITLTKNNPWWNENLSASVDTSTIATRDYVTSVSKISWVAWEDLLENDAVRYWIEEAIIEQTSWTSTNGESYIWYNTTYQSNWQSFYVSWKDKTLTSIDVNLLKQWSPTGNLTMKVYSDTGSTLVATSSNTIAESTLTASYAEYTYTFAWETLTAWQYYMEISDDRANNTSNYSKWAYIVNNCYLYGTAYIINSTSTWSAKAWDHVFSVNLWCEDWQKIYKCDASYYDTIEFIWFVDSATTSWDTATVTPTLEKDWFTWLTEWKTQYLSDTAWEISETPWTNYKPVWIAKSATEVFIDTDCVCKIYSQKGLENNTVYYADRDLMIVARATYWSLVWDLDWYIWLSNTPDVIIARNTVDSWNNSKQTISFIVNRWTYYKIVLWWTNTLNSATAFPL